jgi:hypothetical protein
MPSTIASSALAELGGQLEEVFGACFKLRAIDPYAFALAQSSADKCGNPPNGKKVRLMRRGKTVQLRMRFEAPPNSPVEAIARFRGRRVADLRRTANFFLKNWELRRMLAEYEQYFNDCATQMGRHLEEFVLLHKLAEQLQQTDLTQSPWNFAELVLPIVAEVIRAEAIALLPNKAAHSRRPCAGGRTRVPRLSRDLSSRRTPPADGAQLERIRARVPAQDSQSGRRGFVYRRRSTRMAGGDESPL